MQQLFTISICIIVGQSCAFAQSSSATLARIQQQWTWQNKDTAQIQRYLARVQDSLAIHRPRSSTYYQVTQLLAECYLWDKQWLRAQQYYKQLLTRRNRKKQPKYYRAGNLGLAYTYFCQNQGQLLARLRRKCLRTTPDSLTRFVFTGLQALQYTQRWPYGKAKDSLYQAAVRLLPQAPAYFTTAATYVLDAMGNHYWANKNTSLAKKLYRQNVAWLQRFLWPGHSVYEEFRAKETARSVTRRGKLAEQSYPVMKKFLKKAGISIDYFKKILLTNPQALGLILKSIRLGEMLALEELEDYEAKIRQHLQQVATTLGKTHFIYAWSLSHLGDFLAYDGRHTQAIQVLKEAQRIFLNLDDRKIAHFYATQVDWRLIKGNSLEALAKAEQDFWQVMKVYTQANISDYNWIMAATLANNLIKLGQRAKAYAILKRIEKTLNLSKMVDALFLKTSISRAYYTFIISELASMYLYQGNFQKAENLLHMGLAVLKKELKHHQTVRKVLLITLVWVHHHQKRYPQSDSLFQVFMEQKLTQPLQDSSMVANYSAYGLRLCRRGEYAKADSLYQVIAPIYARQKFTDSTRYFEFQYRRALLQTQLRQNHQASQSWQQVVRWYLSRLDKVYPYLSEAEKLAFQNKSWEQFNNFLSFALEYAPQNSSITGAMYNVQLARKAMLLETSTKMKRSVRQSGDSLLKRLYDEWIDTKEFLNRLYSLSAQQLQQRKVSIEDLEDKVNALEQQLVRQSPYFKQYQARSKPHWRLIQRQLKTGEAAIEMIRITKFANFRNRSRYYVALVITPQTQQAPHLIRLPIPGDSLEYLYNTSYRLPMQGQTNDFLSYDYFFAPIARYLKQQGIHKIYYSPDGVYHKINLQTLRDSSQKYACQHFTIQRLTSTRALLDKPLTTRPTLPKTACLFGNPSFSLDSVAYRQALQRWQSQDTTPWQPQPSTLPVGVQPNYEPLPATHTEVWEVADLCRAQKYQVKLFEKHQAMEEVARAVESPTILHMASHGFFNYYNRRRIGLEKYDYRLISGAGIALAGANQALIDSNRYYGYTIGDGHLQTAEVAQMNLENTELVVLSSCLTGLAWVRHGEEIYGLQRAFKVAGARQVLMSLWQVDDTFTRQFMRQFYGHYLGGKSATRALQLTQAFFKKGDHYAHPYYWGAFVLLGK